MTVVTVSGESTVSTLILQLKQTLSRLADYGCLFGRIYVEVILKAGDGKDSLYSLRGGGEPERGALLLERLPGAHKGGESG